MRGPVAEVRDFLDAALLRPVSPPVADPPDALVRRRLVALTRQDTGDNSHRTP